MRAKEQIKEGSELGELRTNDPGGLGSPAHMVVNSGANKSQSKREGMFSLLLREGVTIETCSLLTFSMVFVLTLFEIVDFFPILFCL